jgi:ankyrin repeat protein
VAEAAAAAASEEWREWAMHGSLEHMQNMRSMAGLDVNGVEASSGRTAVHKAAFWGHAHVIEYLLTQCDKALLTSVDFAGDTALHDAARFGHMKVAEALLGGGGDASKGIVNKKGEKPAAIAREHGYEDLAKLLEQ